MPRHPKLLRTFAMLGGSVALGVATLAAGAAPASAQTVQRVRVVNAGFGYASTRGNVTIGNSSHSTTTPGGSSTSTGRATVTTGNAVAVGNISRTRVGLFTWP
jgi:hypothetical protein